MRRAEILIALALALAASGCMKIYPDPELPDASIGWFNGACDEGVGDVTVTLTGVDDPSAHFASTVPCSAEKVAFVDLPRQRFHIVGQLFDTSGVMITMGEADLDLRNGLDEDAFVNLGGFENFRVAWTFADGASCDSLVSDLIESRFEDASGNVFGYGANCSDGMMLGIGPPGNSYVATLIAYSGDVEVAISGPSAPMPIGPDVADFGTLVLTACAGPCE